MSNNLNLSQVSESQNQKETTINDQAGELDAALTEQFVADVSAGNVALTAAEYRRAIHIKASGAATAGRTVTLQAIKKLSIISNFSTTDSVDFILGSATITLAPAAGAAEPTAALVYTDGTANGLYTVSSGGGGASDFVDLGDVPSSYTGHGGKHVRVDSGETGLEFVSNTYDFGLSYPGGPPASSEVLLSFIVTRDITVPANFSGATGDVGTNPAGTFDIDVLDDGVSIGTISISTGGAFTFTTTSGTAKSIASGSVVRFVAPASPDGTIEEILVGIRATED